MDLISSETVVINRFLSEVLMNTQGGGESLFGSIKIAVLPIAKVFTMCFLGFLMASKYINILPASGRKLLNGLVFSLLLPCLIFSQLGQAITFEKMIEWWFIPFNVVLATISGSLIGLIVALIVRPPYPYFKFTIIHIGIGNIGNVPLVLIAALCRDKSNPFGDSAKCVQDGNAYISFGQWVGAIVLYTYVFQMLAPPPGGSFDVIEQDKLPVKNTPKVNAPPEEVPLLTQEPEPVNEDLSKDGKIKQFLKYWYEKLKLKQIVQPPIIASILAIVIGCIPFLKQMIFTPDAPLYFFTDSCLILGTVEDDIIVDQVDSPEIVDDFEIGQDEAVDIKDKEVNKQKLKRRIDQYKIELRNPCRKGKKLLVLDIDYTLFDHRSTAENSLQLMRPYLHEFLTAAYAEYDIIIWSATSMKWVELKMGQLGVLSNPNYKITALLDHLAMITVQSDSRGIFDCKPLGLIWAHFPEFYSPKNTIMFDDLRRNFVMNPQNGLIIKPFRKAHENRDTDRELVKLTQYLLAIADLDDISVLDHKKWESYDEVSNIKRRRHT